MAKSDVTVKDDIGEDAELLASTICEVAEAAQKLLNGRLSMRAITILIRDASSNTLALGDIEEVLRHAANLKAKYVKK